MSCNIRKILSILLRLHASIVCIYVPTKSQLIPSCCQLLVVAVAAVPLPVLLYSSVPTPRPPFTSTIYPFVSLFFTILQLAREFACLRISYFNDV